MPIIRNGTNITAATFNGTPLTTIIYNGVTVWTSQTNYYTNGTQNVPWTTGYSIGTDGSVSFLSSFVNIQTGWDGINTSANERTIRTTNLINLTNINTLYIEWEGEYRGSPASQVAHFIVSTSATGSAGTFNARSSIIHPVSRQITSLNVSGLTGNYYIRVHNRDGSTSSANGSRLFVYRVWGV